MNGKKLTIPAAGEEVSALLDGPSGAPTLLVLAPGAGAPKDHPFMEAVAAGLAARDLSVLRFNFLYADRGRKAPDRAPVLEQTYRDVAAFVREELHPPRLFVGGKSMGGRIAAQVAAVADAIGGLAGLVFLGYPLHPPGRPDRMRDEHLYEIEAPMLFVEGTRDPFCPLDTLKPILGRLHKADLAVIDDGDHSFKVRKSSGRSTDEALEEVVQAVAGWVANPS